MDSSDVKALVFDVFGTVVDWRTSITRQGNEFGKANGVKADWEAFADSWRSKYRPYMDKVRSGELPWTNLDSLHRMALEDVLSEFEIHGLSEEVKAEFNFAWHRLDGWPDSAPGLWRLKRRFILGPMSNGNVALMTNMGKYAGLPWDCILGAELAKHYKHRHCRPSGRLAGGPESWPQSGLRPPPDGARPQQQARPYSRPILRRSSK